MQRVIGLGCMRLSTDPKRDDARSVDVLHAALDAGVTLLDTADAYCLDDDDCGHNERLIAAALRSWSGDRSTITVATKGGLTRPGGAWVPDGRAKWLKAAVAESRKALGVDRIDLYQLHVVDPRTKLETSVRQLARSKKAGHIRDIGLCNVTLEQLKRAQAITEIAAVQVELSPFRWNAVRSGLAEYCRDQRITLLAYRPLGGAKRAKKLNAEKTLAWLQGLAEVIVPIPGPSRVETAVSAARGQQLTLAAKDVAALDEQHPAVRILRIPREQRRPPDDADGDVVLVMGYPAAGKSTIARELIDQGYERLNRDVAGGTLSGLVTRMTASMAEGRRRFVLDNTYGSRAARNEVIEAAWAYGIPARCIFLDTPVEDAQINACRRMVHEHGRLLTPEEMRASKDPRMFPPRVLFEYRRSLEPPEAEEGLATIDVRPFQRISAYSQRAIVFDAEAVKPKRRPGWLLLGCYWGTGEPDAVLDADEIVSCPHEAGPPICWCRRPLPGLGVLLIERHRLDPAQCIYVGKGANDRLFAKRLGFTHKIKPPEP